MPTDRRFRSAAAQAAEAHQRRLESAVALIATQVADVRIAATADFRVLEAKADRLIDRDISTERSRVTNAIDTEIAQTLDPAVVDALQRIRNVVNPLPR